MPTALVTGGSQGLGLALVRALTSRGWDVVTDARHPDALHDAVRGTGARAVPGDVTDAAHRRALVAAVGPRLDLLVSNASTLGPTPLPALRDLGLDAWRHVLEVDATAPLALAQALLPALRAARGAVLSISSDAAVEPYPGWGAYGAAKAALDQWTAVLGVEEPGLAVYAVDPGDMRTAMHQAAFPGQDIGDRPLPATAVPALLRLVDERPPSGRYRASDLAAVPAEVTA